MCANFPKVYLKILSRHIYSKRNEIISWLYPFSRHSCCNISRIQFAVEVSSERIINIGSSESFGLFSINGYRSMHDANPIIIMLNNVE